MLVLSVIPREVAMHRACGEKSGQDTPAKIEFLWRGRIVGEFLLPIPDRELQLHFFPPRFTGGCINSSSYFADSTYIRLEYSVVTVVRLY